MNQKLNLARADSDSLARAAVNSVRYGFTITPVSKPVSGNKKSGKAPFIKEWQKNGISLRTHTLDEVFDLFSTTYKGCNHAVLTGDIIIADFDSVARQKWAEEEGIDLDTVTVLSGRGFWHKYYYSNGVEYLNTKPFEDFDLKAVSGCAIGAGSIHWTGKVYIYAEGLDPLQMTIKPLPPKLIALMEKKEPDEEVIYIKKGDFDLEKFKESVRKYPKITFPIPEGSRAIMLTRLAGCMKAASATQEELEQYLPLFNQDPEWVERPFSNIGGIIKSARKFPIGERQKLDKIKNDPSSEEVDRKNKPINNIISHDFTEEKKDGESFKQKEIPLPHAERLQITDTGNANLFADKCRDSCIYIPSRGKWVIWDGKCWEPDELLKIDELAKEVVTQKFEDSKGANVPGKIKQHAISSLSLRSRKAMLSCALSSMAKNFDDFDKDLLLLNVSNGILDLAAGELLPHDKNKFMTRFSPYNFSHENGDNCPTWDKFLWTFMSGDQEMINYLQKVVGYCLTGLTREQCMFIFVGNGQNGKSTFTNIIRTLLGSYAISIPSKSIMSQTGSDTIRNDLAMLKGARFVDTSETQEGKKIDEPLLKLMTGGDPITARFLNKEYFTYQPIHKIFLSTNHKPEIMGTDDGIWRRFRMIMCNTCIPAKDRDNNLYDKLLKEMDGILYWAFVGCLLYLDEGLESPQTVKDATEDYRKEQDRLGEIVTEHCDEGGSVRIKDLFDVYRDSCTRNGEKYESRTVFIEKIRKRYTVKKYGDGGYLSAIGISLKA